MRACYYLLPCLLFTASAFAQTAPPAPALDTPEKALEAHFRAFRTANYDTLKKTVLAEGKWAHVVDIDLKFRLWQGFLENAAITRFGKEEGLKVLGNIRPIYEQLDIDIKRAGNPNVDIDKDDPTRATVYLKPEKNPVEGVDAKETYAMKKVGSDWKVDYARTYGWNVPEMTDTLKTYQLAYPAVARAMAKMAANLKTGDYPTADALKAAYDAAWDSIETPPGPADPSAPKDPPTTAPATNQADTPDPAQP